MNNIAYCQKVLSPIGNLTLVASADALIGLYMGTTSHLPSGFAELRESPQHPILRETVKQLAEYFGGKRKRFELPLDPKGTDFQRRCWAYLQTIPFGETSSYKSMATGVGNPLACRAVGGANGKNPISIVIPCHRVIGATGALVGFGGGLPRKAALLSFERSHEFGGQKADEFWKSYESDPTLDESINSS